ncbi:hypothetical protein FRC0477_00768 [Corynebacterium diphtheriae]|nr:hypothetical protein FRC0477_00768 [Corynebacterium diphtheriae]
MPKLTGKLKTITEYPSAVREVLLRAPRTRTAGKAVIVDEPVRITVDEHGEFTADIAPGAAVLVLVGADFMARESIPLLVAEGMTTIAEAMEAAETFTPDVHDRLAELANETAENLDAARSLRAEVDSVAQKMHEAVQKAGVSAEGAARSEKAAGEHASKAGERAGEASAAQAAAEAARDKALTSEQAAGEHVKAAVQSVEQAAIHEQAARAAKAGVTDALDEAKSARTGAEKARDEARQAAESATVGIKPDSVQKSMLAVDLRGEIDAKADSVTVEKRLGEKADLSVVDERIRAIPKPVNTWAELQEKPSKFPPESHKHKITDVTGLQDALDEKTTKAYVDGKLQSLPKPATSWSEIAGKPSVFRPESHTHGTREVWGLDAALQNKASAFDVQSLKAEVAALRTQIPAKRIEVVSKLPSSQDPNTIYFEEA